MKKFELSAYGVEEMSQKELENIDGGAFWVPIIKIFSRFAIETILGTMVNYAIGRYNTETEEVVMTKEYKEGVVTFYNVEGYYGDMIFRADSVVFR